MFVTFHASIGFETNRHELSARAVTWRGKSRWRPSPHRKADAAGKVIKPSQQGHAVAAAAGRGT